MECVVGGPQCGANTAGHYTPPVEGECRAENFGRANAGARFLHAGKDAVQTIVADVPRRCADRDYGRLGQEPTKLSPTRASPDYSDARQHWHERQEIGLGEQSRGQNQ